MYHLNLFDQYNIGVETTKWTRIIEIGKVVYHKLGIQGKKKILRKLSDVAIRPGNEMNFRLVNFSISFHSHGDSAILES